MIGMLPAFHRDKIRGSSLTSMCQGHVAADTRPWLVLLGPLGHAARGGAEGLPSLAIEA